MSLAELEAHFTKYDVKRLELYAQNMVDYHLVIDLLPAISRLFFLGLIDTHLSVVQSVSFYWGKDCIHAIKTIKGIGR